MRNGKIASDIAKSSASPEYEILRTWYLPQARQCEETTAPASAASEAEVKRV